VSERRLDDLVGEAALSRIDMIKLDVEGAEKRALEGARTCLARFRPIVLFEVLDAALGKQGSSRDALLEMLATFDYEFFVFDNESGWPRRSRPEDQSENMIAAPAETPLPQVWRAPRRVHHAVNQPEPEYQLKPLEGEAALFDLLENQICEGSSIDSGVVLALATGAEQWSYAVRFPVREEARTLLSADSRIAVRLEAVVESGRIGFGVVGGDGSTYLTPEIEYGENAQAVSFNLALLGPPPGSAVIVRNTSGNGRPSKVRIHSMSTFVLVASRLSR